MVMIWRNYLSVGNAMLDFEHKDLIGMINSIEYTIGARNSFALLGAVKLFEDRIDAHFADEARLARMLDLPFEQHGATHRRFQEDFRQKTDELVAGIGIWSGKVMDCYPRFLRDWLAGHIVCEDMKMKPALQNLPYNFRPA